MQFIIAYDLITKDKLKGGEIMPKTTVRENETLDDALRRFKRQVNKAGTIQECRKREFFLKPSVARKEKMREFLLPTRYLNIC